jgi:hypothetical protein
MRFGTGTTLAKPGSARGLYLVVSDIEVARADLVARCVDGAKCSIARSGNAPRAARIRRGSTTPRTPRFSDPDGNEWLLQEVTARLPGRVDTDHTTFTSSTELAAARGPRTRHEQRP